MRGLIPFVHGLQQRIALVYNQYWPFRHESQIGLRHYHRHFDYAFFFGVESGHFHVEPYQPLVIHRHIILP